MIKKFVLVLVLFFTLNSIAQNNLSPYSFFGIGEVTESKSVSEENMGGIGGAQNSLYQLHFTNPASYGSLRLTTYAFSGRNKYLSIDDGNDKQDNSTFSISYLALGFPVSKNSGAVFGIQPNSKVGYSISNNVTETETNLFFGEGGTNRVFLGYGYRLPRNFSLGVEASYVFGRTERRILNRRENVQLATMFETNSNVTGFSLKVGAQNSIKITDKVDLKTGVTLHLENDLTSKGDQRIFSLLNSIDPNIVIDRDEILNTDFNSEINLPLKSIINLGVGQENKWYAGAEYSVQDPIFFKNDVLQNTNVVFTKSNKIAFGGYYIPKAESLTNFWQRVTYRAGFYKKELGLKINNAEIDDFGISFGLTLPSKRKLSNVNFGLDLGQRGETSNNLIKENYINFRLSLSFTDRWFKKRKLN
jgi:hypothetical protein